MEEKILQDLISKNKYFFNILKNQCISYSLEKYNSSYYLNLEYNYEYEYCFSEKDSNYLDIFLNNKLETIPDRIDTNSKLSIKYSSIKKIGSHLHTEYLIIEDCPNLKSIGENLFVIKNFKITEQKSGLKILPNKMTINGECDISNSFINKLGYDTIIRGNLKSNKFFNEFPKNFQLYGNLYIPEIKFKNFKNINYLKTIIIEISGDNKIDLNLIKIDNINSEIIMYNYLNFHTKNNFFRKLLDEDFINISKEEIKKYLKGKSNSKEIIINKTDKVNLINYCRNQKIMTFIIKNGYILTKEEYKNIKDYKLKSLYQFNLLKISPKLKKTI